MDLVPWVGQNFPFSLYPDYLYVPLSFLSGRYWSKGSWSVNLITHLHVDPRLRMREVSQPSPMHFNGIVSKAGGGDLLSWERLKLIQRDWYGTGNVKK
jgi:hypothetical protein